MYSILFLLCILCMVVYATLFVRYWEAVSYYGEERVGFHKWLENSIVNLWRRKKL